MKTIRKEKISPIYVDFLPARQKMESGKIYISNKYQSSSHLCLCGCGQECFLLIRDGEWFLTDNGGKVSIVPSILQRFECGSHYIITNGVANFV